MPWPVAHVGKSQRAIAAGAGHYQGDVRNWIRRAREDDGVPSRPVPGLSGRGCEKLRRLRAENKTLRQEDDRVL